MRQGLRPRLCGRLASGIAGICCPAGPAALAHTGSAGLWDLRSTWTWDPWIMVPLAVSLSLYLTGVARVWRRAGAGRGVRRWQVRSFALGWSLLVLALIAPLHWLGERLFVAHMTEHAILMALAAPLIVVARPAGAMLWGLPAAWRSPLGGIRRALVAHSGSRSLMSAPMTTAMHGIAVWVWHVPAFYEAALAGPFLHRLQHLSFFLTALLFWSALVRGAARERGYGGAVLCLFLTSLHATLLGLLLTFARRPIFALQTQAAPQWNFAPLDDQQLAGLVMWVPMGLVYAVAALAFAALWVVHAAQPDRARALGGMA